MCISVVIHCRKHSWNTLNFPRLGMQMNPCSSQCVLWWEGSVCKHCWLQPSNPALFLAPWRISCLGGPAAPLAAQVSPPCALWGEERAGNVGQCLPKTQAEGGESSATAEVWDPVWRGMDSPGGQDQFWELQNCSPRLSVADVGQLWGRRDLGQVLQGKANCSCLGQASPGLHSSYASQDFSSGKDSLPSAWPQEIITCNSAFQTGFPLSFPQ